jgi:hypothetical protein
MFDLCRSEILIYINDTCIKFPSRITVAHSIPAHSFSINKHKESYILDFTYNLLLTRNLWN